ncbi:MAG: SAM-dependent methyltransferase [Anaerolineae bacterium]|nr:SAM-dependent methyltransferase [Anaerolineae bacterium]
MTLEALDFLLSERGAAILSALKPDDLRDQALLSALTRLRRTCSPQEAAAAVTLARLRLRAERKFTRAAKMFFTDEALQQASGEAISRYRARRYAAFDRIADLGCGVGGDTIGLAAAGHEVIAVDRDLLRSRLARANARVLGLDDRVRVVCADLRQQPWGTSAAFVDPSRRVGGRRVFSIYEMEPSLPDILTLRDRMPHMGVKVHPGVDDLGLPSGCEVEFISEGGTCKEAVLWFGDLSTGVPRRATLLPGGHTLAWEPVEPVPVGPPGAYLYEPDPAIIRAHVVEHLAWQIGAHKLDEEIAYLTGDRAVQTPFARCYPVWEALPFNLKELNRRLRTLGVGSVIVKKRGSAVDPEAFRRRLKTVPGGRTAVVVLTRAAGRPIMLICGEAL